MYYSGMNMYSNTSEPFGKITFFHFSLLPSTSDLYPSLLSLISLLLLKVFLLYYPGKLSECYVLFLRLNFLMP